MRYSIAFRDSVLKKVLPPDEQSVAMVSSEAGVSQQTIYKWLLAARNGTLVNEGDVRPNGRRPSEKLTLLLENAAIAENKKGEWLREQGLHSEHLQLWEQELREIMNDKQDKLKEENARLKKDKRILEKELRRKEKALAEMAVLISIKKKAEKIWDDSEDA